MSLSLNEQMQIFFMMLAYGAIASAVFDIFRSIYRTFKPSAVTVGIIDLVFWLVISVSTFYAFFIISDGQIRLFSFLAIILGSIFYFLMLSKVVLFIFLHIFSFFRKIFLLFFKILLTILSFLYKMIYGIGLFFLRPIFWVWKLIKRFIVFSFAKMRYGLISFLRNKKRASNLKRRAINEKKCKKKHIRKKTEKKD